MSTQELETLQTPAPPSKQKLAKATILALLVAAVILVTAVLPAEYGIDPLGTGAALGLTDLANAAAATPAAAPAIVAAPAVTGVYTSHPKIYKVDTEDLVLPPGGGVELKYHMKKGAVMVYAWKANAPVFFEFHGEPDQKPNPDYYESYELDDKVGKNQSNGSFTAPSTGIHGWFWENKGKELVTVHLTTAGFYDAAKLFSDVGEEELTVEDVK